MTDTTTAPLRNADFDWPRFGSQDYFEHNYAEMRADDARILRIVRDWFREAVPAGARLSGIDVGSGTNLSPAFALLPYCGEITLYEYADSNVAWLEDALADVPESWAPFALTASGLEWRLARFGLPSVARVKQGSVFELAKRQWEIGAMFFCAESLTGDFDEFETALDCFLGALRPGSPFAVALMGESGGYEVDGVQYPAVSVDAAKATEAFERLGATDLTAQTIDIDPAPIRAGYANYVVITGRA